MRKVAQKLLRDNMHQKIQSQMRILNPNFEFEHQFMKLPNYPKIILYTNAPSVDVFTAQIFPVFQVVNPKPSSESDEAFTRQIATQLVNPEGESPSNGVIVHGFPFNTTQALLLDKYLNGVNLALHLKSGEESTDYEPLLNYYAERGTLLELEYQQALTAAEVQEIQNKVKAALKLNN